MCCIESLTALMLAVTLIQSKTTSGTNILDNSEKGKTCKEIICKLHKLAL